MAKAIDVSGGTTFLINGAEALRASVYPADAQLDELTGQQLADRRAMLLHTIGHTGPARPTDAIAAALALAAVIAEQDARAGAYAARFGVPYGCICGFTCTGLKAIDDHLDEYIYDPAHDEVWVPQAAGCRDGCHR